MGLLWESKTFLKNANSVVNWTCIFQGGSDLSKEVLCFPVSQRVAKLQSVKLWGLFHRPGLETGPPTHGSTMAEWQNFFSNLQLWQLVTLQSFVLQRPTVSLWKGLSLIKNILSIQKVGRIFNIDFALSKRPHLHWPYVVGGCLFNLGTVPVKLEFGQ